MPTLHTLRSEFIQALQGRVDEAEAAAMFRHLEADVSRAQLRDRMQEVLPGLLSGRPFQYVMGTSWFYGLTLQVNEAVLIPRPETEELVHQIINDVKEWSPDSGAHPLRILDIGTGSGCIALALKKNLPNVQVEAMDVSAAALKVARENAENLKLEVRFMEADILEWDLVVDQELKWDVIVSNPPYITPAEKLEMEAHVLDYEPELALFAPEEAPLIFYQHIADFAGVHLKPSGALYFEINQAMGQEVVNLLEKKGFATVEVLKDMQGADRMVKARRHEHAL